VSAAGPLSGWDHVLVGATESLEDLVGIGTALLFIDWFFRMTGEWNVRAGDRRLPEPLDLDPHTGESAALLDNLPFPLLRCPG